MGGKQRLTGKILQLLPADIDSRMYYEPFVGGGSIFFSVYPQRAHISDMNSLLIKAYHAVKENPHEIMSILDDLAESDGKDTFERVKGDLYNKPDDISLEELGAYFIYINRSTMYGNSHHGSAYYFRRDMKMLDDVEQVKIFLYRPNSILSCSRLLNRAGVFCSHKSFRDIPVERGAFYYFDPPYHDRFNKYKDGKENTHFTEEDQRYLKDMCDRIDGIGSKFMLSNTYNDFIVDLYQGYDVMRFPIKRSIRMLNTKNKIVESEEDEEILVRNYKTNHSLFDV